MDLITVKFHWVSSLIWAINDEPIMLSPRFHVVSRAQIGVMCQMMLHAKSNKRVNKIMPHAKITQYT